MVIDAVSIACVASGYATAANTAYAGTATVASSTYPSFSTNTDGGYGTVCGYSVLYGWTGTTDKLTLSMYTNNSVLQVVSSFVTVMLGLLLLA